MPFEVQVSKNLEHQEGEEETPRYFFEHFFQVDLSKVLPGRGRVARLPVYWRPNPARHPLLKEIYWTMVGSTRVEKGNLAALERAVPEAIAALMEHGTLPYYFLATPQGSFPAYLVRGRLLLKLNSTTLTGRDIGELWHRTAEHLRALGKIEAKEEVEVSILLWKELRVYPTVFVFRNGKTWIPIFSHRERGGLKLTYDLIGVPSRFLEVEEAFDLRREVAAGLVQARALASPAALKIDQLRPELWERMKALVKPTDILLVHRQDGQRAEVPVYEAGGELLALQGASRLRLIFAAELEELSRLVSQDLAERGALAGGSLLAIERQGAGSRR